MVAGSTVAHTMPDTELAKSEGVAVGAKLDSLGGPTGAIFATAKPVTIRIGDWVSKPIAIASIEDSYVYSGRRVRRRPGSPSKGALGEEFVVQHQAVADFGNAQL